MLDVSQSLLPAAPDHRPLRVVVVGLDASSLAEMGRLLTTLRLQIVESMEITLRNIQAATYVSKGKLDEVKQRVLDLAEEGLSPDVVVFDMELTPRQLENLSKVVQRTSMDRAGVIIEIFSQHARTSEARTQVELARLQYLMPRLAHFWTHFERQRGGVGNRGMGETQIEVDRRLLQKRVSHLKNRLKVIEKERNTQRASRSSFFKVALIGYTNAGKSTLLNRMTQGGVLEEDKLFATLDSTVRTLEGCHPPVVVVDTVGFIRNIPTSLIVSFRSTLEELEEADLLLHVVDATSATAQEEIQVTEQILKDQGLEEKPRIKVFNKMDCIEAESERFKEIKVISARAERISAFNEVDLEHLRQKVVDYFRSRMEVWEVLVPYDKSRVESQIRELGSVDTVRYLEKGVFIKVLIDGSWAQKLQLERFRI